MQSLASVRDIWLSLPGVTEGLSYGTPSFKVAGKFLGRLQDDGVHLSVYIDRDEREAWHALAPDTFPIPPHFRKYSYIAVNLQTVSQSDLRTLLHNAWRSRAPAALHSPKR